MSATIDYFMTSLSPWAYLGHRPVREMAARHGVKLVVKPINLGGVFEITGQVPLGQRPVVRRHYRDIELQRYAEMRGRTANLRPKHFPTDPTLADLTIIAILADGGDPLDYMDRVFSALWAQERDIADRAVLAELLGQSGFDAPTILARAGEPEAAAVRAANTAEANAIGVVGVPTYVLNGEPFWGQDRIDLLERAVASGRAPFKAS